MPSFPLKTYALPELIIFVRSLQVYKTVMRNTRENVRHAVAIKIAGGSY